MSIRRTRMPAGEAPALAGCKVTLAADFNIPDATDTAVVWDTEAFDTASMHSAGTNPSRITIPEDGTYLVGFHASMETDGAGAGGRNYSLIKKWGEVDQVVLIAMTPVPSATENDLWQTFATPQSFVVGDWIELIIFQNSTVTIQVEGGSDSSAMWAYKIG